MNIPRHARPTHKLWCTNCGYKTPQACRPDLPIGPESLGLLWQCMRCGTTVSRSYHSVSCSERIEERDY